MSLGINGACALQLGVFELIQAQLIGIFLSGLVEKWQSVAAAHGQSCLSPVFGIIWVFVVGRMRNVVTQEKQGILQH